MSTITTEDGVEIFHKDWGPKNAQPSSLVSLSCFAPAIVEAILDGRQSKALRLADMLGNGPLIWDAKRETGAFSN
jgi:hypothetical protein